DAITEVLRVRHPRPVVGHQRVLVTDLQTVRAGDVRDRAFPQVRAGIGDAEVLRPVDEPGNVPVRRAAVGALFGDANQIARRIWFALEVANAEIGAAKAGFEEQPAPQRRGPGDLRHVQGTPAHAAGLGRDTRALGQAWSRARARAAQRLRVPEGGDFVAGRHLPRHASADVLEDAIRVLPAAVIGRIQPRRRIAGVQVVVDVRARL